MATGQEMLISTLLKALGIDATLKKQIEDTVQFCATIDARLKSIEAKLDIAIGETHGRHDLSSIEPVGAAQLVNGGNEND